MKTVRDACKLQPNALSIKLSDQIEQLDELIHTEGDGTAFFEKTFITQGMQDLGNGYVTKKPKKKRTSVQVIAESDPDDEGKVRLRVNAQNAGPAPRIHFAENTPVTGISPQLKDQLYTTKALRVNFLVEDPSGQYETGDVVTWSNKLV
ncbi:MAG: hypothetical protein HY736_12580, partial [Verrucomicrobia bacterium]|nr:hypothetical protein [Verrucomicrobiota bacterium]